MYTESFAMFPMERSNPVHFILRFFIIQCMSFIFQGQVHQRISSLWFEASVILLCKSGVCRKQAIECIWWASILQRSEEYLENCMNTGRVVANVKMSFPNLFPSWNINHAKLWNDESWNFNHPELPFACPSKRQADLIVTLAIAVSCTRITMYGE